MSAIESPIHIEPGPEGWKVVIGPFRDVDLARHVVATLKELGEEGLNLLQVAALPAPVLMALVDAEKEIGNRQGSYDLSVQAGADGDRTATTKRSRVFRSRRRKPGGGLSVGVLNDVLELRDSLRKKKSL